MSWSFSPHPSTFLQQRRQCLVDNESLHCLAWAAIKRAEASDPAEPSHTFLTFMDNNTVSAHAFMDNRDHALVLSSMSTHRAEQLAITLDTHGVHMGSVEGPSQAVAAFSAERQRITGTTHDYVMNQGLYELKSVVMPSLEGGRLVCATQPLRSKLIEMLEGFASSFPEQAMNISGLEKRADRFIREKRAFLWQTAEEDVVSMASVVRRSPRTSSISWVYTPPEHQRQGHAGRVVATLSQSELDAGMHACNLFTDMANATSNGVYQRIGYLKIADFMRMRLNASPSGQ